MTIIIIIITIADTVSPTASASHIFRTVVRLVDDEMVVGRFGNYLLLNI